MLTRLLQTPEIHFENGTATLNKRICGQISKTALHGAFQTIKTVKTADDPEGTLDRLHDDLRILTELVPQLEKHAAQLLDTALILRGEPVRGTGDMIEVAMTTRALADQISLVAPDADLSDIDETADQLEKAANAVAIEAEAVQGRIAKLDAVCRDTTGAVLCRGDLTDEEAERILEKYELPQSWEAEIEGEIQVDKAAHRAYVQDLLTVKMLNQKHGHNAYKTDAPKPATRGELIRRACRAFALRDGNQDRKRRNKAKQAKRVNLQAQAAEVWANV